MAYYTHIQFVLVKNRILVHPLFLWTEIQLIFNNHYYFIFLYVSNMYLIMNICVCCSKLQLASWHYKEIHNNSNGIKDKECPSMSSHRSGWPGVSTDSRRWCGGRLFDGRRRPAVIRHRSGWSDGRRWCGGRLFDVRRRLAVIRHRSGWSGVSTDSRRWCGGRLFHVCRRLAVIRYRSG